VINILLNLKTKCKYNSCSCIDYNQSGKLAGLTIVPKIGPSEVRAALQMGCVANIVATEFIVLFSFSLRLVTFLILRLDLGS
jgi:hypothetical protein